ncbi:MAG TPA: GspH/FimT family pseudopilin [Coleofasciculaceae cyanobacterium]
MNLLRFYLATQRSNRSIAHFSRIYGHSRSTAAGFTVIEVLVVVMVVGILAAIAAPGWQSFQSSRSLTNAQDEIFQAIRQTQAEALRSHGTWQVSFRETGNQLQWAMHPASTDPAAATWQTILAGTHIDPNNTTLNQQGILYRLQFNERGQVNGQLGRLTLKTSDSDRIKRCVFASTLLGTLRKDADQRCQ